MLETMSSANLFEMVPTTSEATRAKVVELVAPRAATYESFVQTSVFWCSDSGWRNSLTKLEFTRKNEKPPAGLTYEYPDIHIVRRLMPAKEFTDFLARIVEKHTLDSGTKELPFEGAFSIGSKSRQPHSEWSQWPADIFVMEQSSAQGQNWPPDQPLIDLSAPYYPSLGHVLSDLFGIRIENWTNYLRGQVTVVLPDFRARISKLTVASTYARADLECVFSQPTKLIVKAYAENRAMKILAVSRMLNEPTPLQIDVAASRAPITTQKRTARRTLKRT